MGDVILMPNNLNQVEEDINERALKIQGLCSVSHGPRFALVLEGVAADVFARGAEEFLKSFPLLRVIGGRAAHVRLVIISDTCSAKQVREHWEEECFGALFYLLETCKFHGRLLVNEEATRLLRRRLSIFGFDNVGDNI